VEIRELRHFITVAEELHFGRAAQRLGIAQQPLSRTITQLERRLGVALLERTNRKVTLTEAGSVLLAEGRARAAQPTSQWKARYNIRAGVEGTMRQATHVTGIRRARYLGVHKTRLEHNAAAAVNLIRLDAWWTGRPLDRTRTSHLQRLHLSIAA
jgi:Bacterial regulatory helix-turn-helix protein, lysR family/Transposase DDE domain